MLTIIYSFFYNYLLVVSNYHCTIPSWILFVVVHSDEPTPPMRALHSFVHSELYDHIFIFIIILFILWLFYFIHLVFRTHVSSCVRSGIKHPNLNYLFWGVREIIILLLQLIKSCLNTGMKLKPCYSLFISKDMSST
jgi:hypothetical protein